MPSDAPLILDRDGRPGVLVTHPADLTAHDARVVIQLPNGRRLDVPIALVFVLDDEHYRADLSFAELATDGTQVLHEVAERLNVCVRTVETGRVRAVRRVETREETVDEPTWHETVEVERVPINAYVEEARPIRQEGDVTVVPVYAEVLVVEKRLLLQEEVRLTTRRTEVRDPQRVVLRRTHVEVERLPAAPPDPAT